MGRVTINTVQAEDGYIKQLIGHIKQQENLSQKELAEITGKFKAFVFLSYLMLTSEDISEVEQKLEAHFGSQKIAQYQRELLEQAETEITR